MDVHTGEDGKTAVANTVAADEPKGLPLSNTAHARGAPEIVEYNGGQTYNGGVSVEDIDESKKGWFVYFKTKDFYIVLLLGYILPPNFPIDSNRIAEKETKSSPSPLHHRYQHLLVPPCRSRHLHPRLPNLLQLRPS